MYKFSNRSRRNLQGVHSDLVAVVERALELTPTDFMVAEGVRSLERQRQLVAAGDSWTLDSRHLTGHAVDLWAWVAGDISWNWDHYFEIAVAVRKAAQELRTPLTWGGLWKERLDLTRRPLPALQRDYVTSFRAQEGRSPMLDGPHFELNRAAYPAD